MICSLEQVFVLLRQMFGYFPFMDQVFYSKALLILVVVNREHGIRLSASHIF